MQKLKVASNEAGQRLDKLLSKYLSQAGKGFLYKMMRKKNITLNGKKCDGSERVEEGDEISLFLADETIEKFSAPLPELAALGKEKDRNAGNGLSYAGADPWRTCFHLYMESEGWGSERIYSGVFL